MRRKTSITLDPETLVAIDALTGGGTNRSRLIERAVLEFLERHRKALRDQRDLEILDRHADELSSEAEDALSYQAEL